VMDIDVDTVDTASVNSSPEIESEDTVELAGTDELECLELASECRQLTNSSDDLDIRYGAR